MMDTQIIYGLIYLSATLWSFYFWKKYKDKGNLVLTWIGLFATIFSVFDYVLKNIFHSSLELKLISDIVFLIFAPVAVILIIKVLLQRRK